MLFNLHEIFSNIDANRPLTGNTYVLSHLYLLNTYLLYCLLFTFFNLTLILKFLLLFGLIGKNRVSIIGQS